MEPKAYMQADRVKASSDMVCEVCKDFHARQYDGDALLDVNIEILVFS